MHIDEKFVKKYDGLIKDRLDRMGITGDAFDEIRAKVYERILTSDSYDPMRGKISTWLWQVIRSVVSNERKKASRSKDALDHDLLSLDEATHIIGPEDAGEARDEIHRLIDAADIVPRDKRIFLDFHLNGYTSKDLALKHDMNQRTVEQIIFRTMQALREIAAA
jgi:RNA polymerase sigma factor (sigma-70 family)